VLGGLHYGDAATARDRSWLCLAPDAPLRRCRLVHTEGIQGAGWGHEPLRLDRRIGSYLLGVNFLDEQTDALLRMVEDAAALSPDQQEMAHRLERRVRAWSDRDRMPAMNLVGREAGCCKAIARHLCSRIGIALYALDPLRLPPQPAERQVCWRLLE